MTTSDWAIPQQAKLKYTQLFNLHDRSRSGFLSGLQCRDILMQSGLPRNILAEIWNLSDIDGDGQLTREEFILAMHLTNQVRAGNQLPAELPADLIPPSYRKTRSISTLSVQSTASSTASGSGAVTSTTQATTNDELTSQVASSVLNSNTFEDKRRENFEKGRSELERRRQKMIESQISVLSEQLVSWKKQVAEAKAKIDAMRSDRDTKAGLLTSLEAQLQTIRDRKAFLQHEEQNLIAIAKDLNLVNSTHSTELDQQACTVKQESIKQMKEKLVELKQEKEEKAKELVEATLKLDGLKKEFKTLSEDVGKVYQDYEEKLTTAKVMKEKFMEENKSKPIDLDAVWDSVPSGFPTNVTPKTAAPKPADTFGAPTDDPWASSPGPPSKSPETTNEPFTFNTSDDTFSNNQGVGKNVYNNNDTEFSPARDYSAFAETSQTTKMVASSQDESGVSNNLLKSNQASKKYRALYAFEARNPDELTINPGDLIIGSDHICEPGWLSGEANGQIGLFPEAYVELIPDELTEETPKPPISIETSTICQQTVDSKSTISSHVAQQPTVIKYKVIYTFEARNPDELTINPGDIITGVEGVHEPGWLMGELHGQRGLFPEAYVEQFATEVAPTASEQSTEQTTGILRRGSSSGSLRSKKSRAKKAEVATVIANYRALGQEQLNLEKGQLVLIRRKMDSGWWEGELQIKDKSELDHLISELISSEWDYVNDLRLCQSAYIIPLSSSFDVSHIFTNWNQLIHVHEKTLTKLPEIPSDNPEYSKQFKEAVFETFLVLLNSIVTLYIEFCSRQNESNRRLEAKIASDIRFKQLINESQRTLRTLIERQQQQQQSEKNGHDIIGEHHSRAMRNSKLPLVSFLLKPMQRITKYSLIFERMLRLAENSTPQYISHVVRLYSSAQSLCQQVNEACRVKEDDQENIRRLRWCQNHIKQQTLTESVILDKSLSSGGNGSGPTYSRQNSSLGSTTIEQQSAHFEPIEFDSSTSFQGPRKFIKASSLLKLKSGRELVAFLFNDLLLLTQVKGGISLRIASDLFKSERAQQAYYKIYKAPILLADLQIQDAADTEEQQLQMLSSLMMCRPSLTASSLSSSSSATDENGPAPVCFVDTHNGIPYSLMALSAEDQSDWLRLLGELSNQARETRALRLSPLVGSKLAKRPGASQCLGRLLVKILELSVQQSSGNKLQLTNLGHYQASGELQQLERPRSLSPGQLDSVGTNVCVKLQMRRYRRRGPSLETETARRHVEVTQLSDEYRTKTVKIGDIGGAGGESLGSVTFDADDVQFLIPERPIDFSSEAGDYLEIEVTSDYRFRENSLIARKRLSIDDLIGRENPKPIIDFGESSNTHRRSVRSSATHALIPNRPIDLTFKLKPSNNLPLTQSLSFRRSLASRHSMGRPPSSFSASPLNDSQPSSPGNSTDNAAKHKVSVKLRLYLQLFCD